MNKLPDYSISSRHGYHYVRFKFSPPNWLRNRMRAAGMYWNRSEQVWIADDRFTPVTIARIIGINRPDVSAREVSQ